MHASILQSNASFHTQDLLVDLKQCSRTRDLSLGKQLHAKVLENGQDCNMYVLNTLISMYSKCGSMPKARQVFDNLSNPNVVSWNALLLGYADNGEVISVLNLFSKAKACGCTPDSLTYIAALKACIFLALNGNVSAGLQKGRAIHLQIGPETRDTVRNKLIEMYADCGCMAEAHLVFDSILSPEVVSWTVLIMGYAKNNQGLVALDLFSSMKEEGCEPDSVTYVAALKACTSLALNGNVGEYLQRGRKIHLEVGSYLNCYVKNTLIDMYAKFSDMVEAHRVFDTIRNSDVVSWNALLLGYVDNGEGFVTLKLFSRMKLCGVLPDYLSYIAAIKACMSLGVTINESLERGREIHLEICCDLNPCVLSTLIDMYAKCGSMSEACSAFDLLQKPNVVSWNALLLGYVENGQGRAALDLFTTMKEVGTFVPDYLTYIAALKACSLVGALALGRKFHAEITEINARLVTSLVDFYGKCGNMRAAREVFDLHSATRDVSTWNALLAGYSRFGDNKRLFDLFEAMQSEGFQPDAVTFGCIFLCCSHLGTVEKAKEYFEKMELQYGVIPTAKHYNSMVDALGRANQLKEALALLKKMPCNLEAFTWRVLLGACCKWKNLEIGRLAFQSFVGMNGNDASAHLLMTRIYSSAGKS